MNGTFRKAKYFNSSVDNLSFHDPIVARVEIKSSVKVENSIVIVRFEIAALPDLKQNAALPDQHKIAPSPAGHQSTLSWRTGNVLTNLEKQQNLVNRFNLLR